jgi:hypothetical protein
MVFTPREEATVRQHVHARDPTRMPREGGEGGAVFVPQAQGMVFTPREEATVRQHAARPVTEPVCPTRVARGVPSLSHKRKVLS